MRYSHQKLVSTLLTTLILVINCVSAEPKKKRVIIHVPETVKHVHHHITKKVPLPIVVFTKNPKEPKPHKEYHKEPYFLESKEPYYHEHKEPYHHKESYHHEPYHQHESYHHESYHHEPKESYYHEHKESYHHEPASYHEHKDSYHHEPSYHKESYGNEPSYHKESYHPEPSYHKESYGNEPSYHKEPYHPEPSYHKESYHHEPGYHKESYGNEHGPGYEAEYEGSEHSYVTRGIRESDVHMARGVVADYHEAKPKVIKPASGAPLLHLTPPRHSIKAAKTHDWGAKTHDWGAKTHDWGAKTYDWGAKRGDEYNYGSFKSYVPPSPRPPTLGQPGGKSQHYFHIGPPEPTTHGPSAAHAPTEGAVKKSKKKSRVGKRRVPHTLHDYDPTGGLALPTNQTPYTVNEFIEEDFRR